MNFEVRTISSFEKEFKRLFKKYPSLKSDLLILISQLEVHPFQGIALGKDFYKIRLSISSKGKRKVRWFKNNNMCKIAQGVVYFASIYDNPKSLL